MESEDYRPQQIISGGQTGVDRGALNAAILLDIPHGGTCPRGRRAEDGAIPGRYLLTESKSPEYTVRTRINVEDGDATLVVIGGKGAGRGTRLTLKVAESKGRPVLMVETRGRDEPDEADEERVRKWLAEHRPKVLNVAGTRGSEAPEGERFTRDLLVRVCS